MRDYYGGVSDEDWKQPGSIDIRLLSTCPVKNPMLSVLISRPGSKLVIYDQYEYAIEDADHKTIGYGQTPYEAWSNAVTRIAARSV